MGVGDDEAPDNDGRITFDAQLHESLNASVPVRIVERGPLRLVDTATGAGIRPCAHPGYILDDRWMTVTCSECKERLEPYALLRWNAGVLDAIKHERAMNEHAEYQLRAARVRELLDRKQFDTERDALKRRTYVYGKDSLVQIRALQDEIERRVDEDKQARARRKVTKKGGVCRVTRVTTLRPPRSE